LLGGLQRSPRSLSRILGVLHTCKKRKKEGKGEKGKVSESLKGKKRGRKEGMKKEREKKEK